MNMLRIFDQNIGLILWLIFGIFMLMLLIIKILKPKKLYLNFLAITLPITIICITLINLISPTINEIVISKRSLFLIDYITVILTILFILLILIIQMYYGAIAGILLQLMIQRILTTFYENKHFHLYLIGLFLLEFCTLIINIGNFYFFSGLLIGQMFTYLYFKTENTQFNT